MMVGEQELSAPHKGCRPSTTTNISESIPRGMVDGLTALLGLGGSVRLLLSCSAPLHDALRSRLELATPLTAYNRRAFLVGSTSALDGC